MSSNIVFKNSTGHTLADGKLLGGPATSAQGQTLISNVNNDFAATPMQFSYKNKIINGAMNVNQRNNKYNYSAFSSIFSGYNLDRWKCEYKTGIVINSTLSVISDFSSGNTFALNGFTEVNEGATNQWRIGSSGGTGTNGNSAYIVDTTTSMKGYSTTSLSIVHFYKDVVVPNSAVGTVCVAFDGNTMGEASFDYLLVTVASTSYVPVSGTLPVGTQVFTGSSYSTSVLYTGPFLSSSLDAYRGQTVRLIFTWKNDGSVGTNTGGASVDNIRFIDKGTETLSSLGYKSLTPTTQITSISNFEAGNTFALNGFTEVNGTQTNKWYVGTFGGTGQSGTYSAVISNNGTAKGYTLTATSVVHFYKDITIPSLPSDYTTIYLRFNATVAGEYSTTLSTYYDYLSVRIVPTSTTPVAGTQLATGYEILKSYNATGTTSVNLTGLEGFTVRLVFTWVNDSTAGTTSGGATVDNIEFYQSTATSQNMITQSTSVYPNGFSNSMAYENLAFTPCIINQPIEAYNCQEFLFGTSSAKDVAVSFWVRSGEVGTYCMYLQNAAKTLTYIKEYTINEADTWERKTLIIPGCTTGTWTAGTSSAYMILGFSLEDGFTATDNPNSWNANSFTQSVRQKNFSRSANLGKFFYITGVQLEIGSICTPFEMKPFHTELLLCQRYFQKNMAKTVSGASFGTGVAASTTSASFYVKYNTLLRASPTMIYNSLYSISMSDGGALRQISAYSFASTLTSGTVTATAAFSNLTANRAQTLVQTGPTPAWYAFSAEL